MVDDDRRKNTQILPNFKHLQRTSCTSAFTTLAVDLVDEEAARQDGGRQTYPMWQKEEERETATHKFKEQRVSKDLECELVVGTCRYITQFHHSDCHNYLSKVTWRCLAARIERSITVTRSE